MARHKGAFAKILVDHNTERQTGPSRPQKHAVSRTGLSRRTALMLRLCTSKTPQHRPTGTRYALPGTVKILRAFARPQKLLDAVWQCEADVPHIRRIHYHHVRELAHAPGLLGAKQV